MVVDSEQPDPALLAKRQCDEAAQFDQFRFGELLMQPIPQVISRLQSPADRFRVGEGGFLPMVVLLMSRN